MFSHEYSLPGTKSEDIIILDSYQGNVLLTAEGNDFVELYT
jgi:hypothetical protein